MEQLLATPHFDVAQYLKKFVLQRVLNEEITTHSIYLLGTLPLNTNDGECGRSPAIIKLERIALSSSDSGRVFTDLVDRLKLIEHNDIYTWMFGWLKQLHDVPDIKINVIFPATETHIKKYSKQDSFMIQETAELYERVVRPYIDNFPAERTQWVEDILSGKAETEKILYKDATPIYGFVILPDMKWDLSNVSSLYLVAITLSKEIRSLRDLRKRHLPMLRSIRNEADRIVLDKWSLRPNMLRYYVHYQPSYYHFHVHIVHTGCNELSGMIAGRAHLLNDLISLLEIDTVHSGPSIFERMTLTYELGEKHGLYEAMHSAQSELMNSNEN